MIASFNMGRLRHDWDDPRIAPFAQSLDRVYALARRAPGYVWHLDDRAMEAEQLDPGGPLGGDPRVASALSVWASVGTLAAFALTGLHGAFVSRRHAWFERATGPGHVMWRIADGARPTVAEGVARLSRLAREGASDAAFGWEHARSRGWLDARA